MIALALVAATPADAIDIFGTEGGLPPRVGGDILGKREICAFSKLGNPLALQEAIERALCNNPKTKEAWASVKVQAAEVGIAKAAYLPVLSGSFQEVRDHASTDVIMLPAFSTSQSALQRSDYVTLNWVLFDFGARGAGVDSAVALLGAAQANQQATLQNTFVLVAKDYYAAQTAQSAFLVTQEVERTAEQSLKAATQRVALGVAPISDQLQAQTSAAQAIFNRVRANGDWQIAVGTLASDMAIASYTPLHLPDIDEELAAILTFNEAIAALIEYARRSHPTVLVAKAQVDAAEAKAVQAQRDGLPSLSLVGRNSRSNQPVSPGFGQIPLPSVGKDAYIGLQVTIPIFEGFARTYQARQAENQVEVQRAVLAETEQKVALDVWSSYQTLNTTTENLTNSASLLAIAQHSYKVAQIRYESGAGSILELLTAQSSLATAQRQRIQALSDWRTARLQLAGALGRLGTWDGSFAR